MAVHKTHAARGPKNPSGKIINSDHGGGRRTKGLSLLYPLLVSRARTAHIVRGSGRERERSSDVCSSDLYGEHLPFHRVSSRSASQSAVTKVKWLSIKPMPQGDPRIQAARS